MDYHKTIKKRNNNKNYKVSSFTPILKKNYFRCRNMAGIESYRPPDLNNILEQQELNQLSADIKQKIQNVFKSRTEQYEDLKVKYERLTVTSGTKAKMWTPVYFVYNGRANIFCISFSILFPS